MLISLNEIKKYVEIPEEMISTELLERIGSRLVEIEEVTDLAPKYKGIYIVKVMSAKSIEGTHLTVCQVDVGERTAEFAEEGEESVQVVCGAPNVRAGMFAVWIAPGAIVPATFGDENFRLSVRKLQGYKSHGMLAAIDELDLGADHEGIAEIDPKDAQPGDEFAEAFGLNDLIIDVENKSLTHRPDCFGLIGFAREIAGILGQKFVEPEWPEMGKAGDLPIEVEIQDEELCPRYSCAVFDLGENKPSKYLTAEAVFLAKAGMRAIDPMVDLTNIMMLEMGQPLHAFDYDKLVAVGGTKAPKIVVRAAKAGEELQLLDGKTIECIPEDILITSNNKPVALAGAMGGKNTEIDASTKRVVLESATFSLYHLRKTQMAHGIFSEAITRFTKGQPAAMTKPVLAETLARMATKPLAAADNYPGRARREEVSVSAEQVNGLLGAHYSVEEMISTLRNVGFEVETAKLDDDESVLKVKVPEWRTDIHIAEDVIEEIGRLRGFDNLALDLPRKSFRGTEVTPTWQLKKELRGILSGKLGMNELLTYSFVSKNLLTRTGQKVEESYEITNSISPELECFRQAVAPSLIEKVRENVKAGHKDFSIYEMNQVSRCGFGMTEEGTPKLENHLGMVVLGDFYKMKAMVLAAMRRGLKVEIEYQQMTANSKAAEEYPYLEPKRSAVVTAGGEVIGAFGEVKAVVARKMKLEGAVAAAELCLDKIVELPRQMTVSPKISKFPFVERDITLKVGKEAQFGRFYNVIDEALEGLIFQVSPLSVYQEVLGAGSSVGSAGSKVAKVFKEGASGLGATRNLSFHLKFANPEKTLAQEEISDIMKEVEARVVALGAEIV